MASERDKELLAVSNLIRTPEGRAFMWRFLQRARTHVNIFDNDPIKHAFNAGSRDMGLWLEAEIKDASPDLYIKMIKEQTNE